MRDGVVKRVRRGGSSQADGCLITRLAIWAAVTEPLNPVCYSEGVGVNRECALFHTLMLRSTDVKTLMGT